MENILKKGHTNKIKKIKNDNLIIVKTYTGFNHLLNYEDIQIFDFVPKLVSENKKEVIWKIIDGENLNNPQTDDLIRLAKMIRKIHTSDLKLPKNNLRKRIRKYLKIIHDKYLNIPEIDENWKIMNDLITKMGKLNPLHNDIWWENLIKDKEGKIWIVDWEYATMGDKHFDLAYYIESSKLSKEKEKIFLNAYNDTETYQAYIPEWMPKYKMFVNWLTLLWGYAQDEIPFPMENIFERVRELKKEI
ncbi:MAG: phosphotransferase [Mycoplasmatales bacterium]|nr:phosphotransferase [Mycoplasmatales bacterium]